MSDIAADQFLCSDGVWYIIPTYYKLARIMVTRFAGMNRKKAHTLIITKQT